MKALGERVPWLLVGSGKEQADGHEAFHNFF